jgi:hypothetical protein
LPKGDIYARNNGKTLVMAQQKERGKTDPSHSFHVPFADRFTDAGD